MYSNRHDMLDTLLTAVEKPSRYIGGEWNSVVKDPARVRLRVALAFPDLYELGLGNLGLQILYSILNAREDIWAERVCLPAPDLAGLLRKNGRPLFLLESRDPLAEADVIGFTLQSELTYANILEMLDLAGLPVRSADRAEDAPLVLAGGPCAVNPEPLAPFIDAFLIGDGEDAIIEIADALIPLRRAPRNRRLDALAEISGVYVPARHPLEYLGGRLLACPEPRVRRRTVIALDRAPFPRNPVVPFTQLIHDGAGIEVLRGCTQGCRFCQAGMITRPVREREISTIADAVDAVLQRTGLESVSLVSLSTCDYSRARAMIEAAAARAREHMAGVSLPSIRLDSFSVALADLVAGVRRSGLTFAPEAASPRLRAVINKNISDEDLIRLAEEAFRRGWRHVKTYFMIGLPTETDADVLAIADLCVRLLEAGRRVRPDAMVRTGVSTFVPKPHTPFQWAPQISREETERRQRLLLDRLRWHRAIHFGRHNPVASFIEGLISRAGREAADLIETAWRAGAGYETWEEKLRPDPWFQAVERTGYRVDAALGPREPGERLPWDHIDTLVDPGWLRQEWDRALSLEIETDCRKGKCNRCGLVREMPKVCGTMIIRSKNGRMDTPLEDSVPSGSEPDENNADLGSAPGTLPAAIVRPAVSRIRFRVARIGSVRLLSHLETATVWIRALRRAGVPMAYSQGFHAHPKVTFALASPVGEETVDDPMDVELVDDIDPETARAALAAALPGGFNVCSARTVPLNAPSLMADLAAITYAVWVPANPETLRRRVADLLARDRLPVSRSVKHRPSPTGRHVVEVDLRPLIESLDIGTVPDDSRVVLRFTTRARDGRMAKVKELLQLLELDPADCLARRLRVMLCSEEQAAPDDLAALRLDSV